MSGLVHIHGCGGFAEPLDVDRPDPDRHGNIHVPFKCECGERARVVSPRRGPKHPPTGFAFTDEIDWAVEL